MTKREADKYRGRLLGLVALLRKLPPEKFNYNTWVGVDWKGKQDLSCGTTACALGWATTMPQLRRLGLRLSKDFSVMLLNKTYDPIDAACEVFGLTYSEAEFLFVPGQYTKWGTSPEDNATAKQVAAHIERFVRKWSPEKDDVQE